MAKKQKREMSADQVILKDLWQGLPAELLEQKIKQHLRYYKCGPYDPERVELLRELLVEVDRETNRRRKSQYYVKKKGKSDDVNDFDVERMINDYSQKFPTVGRDEIGWTVRQSIFGNYLR